MAEDNEIARGLTVSILEEYGYRVIDAVDGADAIEKFSKHRDRVDLLILDVIMPKINGKEAYEEIKKDAPGIKTLFLSGYTKDIIHRRGILEKSINLISKPVSPAIFLRKVREILDT